MFRAILFTQWKLSRWYLGPMALAAFTLPVVSVQQAGIGFGVFTDRFATSAVLSTIEFYSVGYPVLAALVAVIMAATAWAADEKGRHVYALSLPVPRWHYVLLRFGAGAFLLLAPVLGLAAGAILASAAATIPPGMESHPVALTVRFALALGLAYALIFALTAAGEQVGRYLAAVVGLLVILHIVLAMFQVGDLIVWVGEALLRWPGPLEIFTGRWMLIDV